MQQNIEISTLPNGLTVITDAMPTIATASVGFWFGVGARHEPEDACGVAHIVEHMLFKGTTTRTTQQIANELENVGALMNAHTGKEETAYYCKLPATDVERGIAIYSDMILNATLPMDELQRERNVIVQELRQTYDDPESFLYYQFIRQLYAGQLYGRPIIGEADEIAVMAREKLERYIATNYHVGNACFIASGNVRHAEVRNWVEKYAGGMKTGPKATFARPTFTPNNVAFERDVEQVHMMITMPCATHGDPDYYATNVLSQILGGGMSSRLFVEVREKRGLVYHVASYTIQYSDAGTFTIYASATPNNVGEVVRVATGELAKVADTVTDEELLRAKTQIKAQLLMQLESTSRRTDRIGDQWHTYGRVIPLDETVANIDKVSKEDIARVAQKLCTGPVASGICGPVAKVKDMPDIAQRLVG